MSNQKATSLTQFLKSGVKFEFMKVDYSTQQITKEVSSLKERQEAVIKSAEVDLNELKKITFTV